MRNFWLKKAAFADGQIDEEEMQNVRYEKEPKLKSKRAKLATAICVFQL